MTAVDSSVFDNLDSHAHICTLLDKNPSLISAGKMTQQYMNPHPEMLKKHLEDKEKRKS